MKLILATTPFLAKFAFSIPFAPPPAIPQVVNEPTTNAALDCSDVWSRTCSGTNSNGESIHGTWTCGERVQYNMDYKLGRTPSMSAAIVQILSECPTQCGELANNQCDTYVETHLETVSESDCSATWDAVCSGVNSDGRRIKGSWKCGERVVYDNQFFRNQLSSTRHTYYQCKDQCEHIAKNQCATFVEGKLNEIQQQIDNNNDDYESIDATPAPLGTCQEAYDRVCNEGYGIYTCGERVGYVFEHPLRQNAYMNAIGSNAVIADAIAEVYRQCPNQCREFQNNNCDTLVEQNYAATQNENGSGSV
jgi:hypothetical protein